MELPSMYQELREIRGFARRPNHINEHLELIFTESLLIWPRLIVELGVWAGTSTFVFERVCHYGPISFFVKLLRAPPVRRHQLLARKENPGFAGGNNRGIEDALRRGEPTSSCRTMIFR